MRESFPTFERGVAGGDDSAKNGQPFDVAPDADSARAEKPAAKEKLPPEVQEYMERTQKLIDGHKRLFTTFAKDVSLSFKVSDGFYIDLEKGEVNLDAKWFKEKGFTERQALWAVLHELSHFRDLAEDPEKMMAGFDRMRDQARETGAKMMAKWEAKYGADDPEYIARLKKPVPNKKHPARAMNRVEAAAYKMHHTYGNVFDDIYVNAMVARRAPAFEAGSEGGSEIEKLYKEKLFKSTDYRKQPRHLQFLYALLRKEMVPGEELEISDDVRALLESKVKFQGKEHTPAEIVAKFLKPGTKRDTKAGVRQIILKRTLEPLFMELLGKDLEEWDPVKPPTPPKNEPKKDDQPQDGDPQDGEGEPGDPNPFADDYDDFSANSPDQLDDDDVADWLDKHEGDKADSAAKAAKEAKDEHKTAEEKAAEQAEAQDKAWCKANDIKHENLKDFREVEARVAPHLQDLAALWDKIILGSSREMKRSKEGYFKTGSSLDIQQVVNEWSKIDERRFDDVRVMEREVSKEVLVKKPELIRVRLVADQSGSMDSAKRRVLEDCVVLLLSSVREFNTKLNLTRSQTKSSLQADTEVWGFGSSAVKIKPLREGRTQDEEYADMVRAFGSLQESLGSTSDHLALGEIAQQITPEDRERISTGKVLDIVFEITDGGSDNATATRREADGLLESGLVARAFQIGAVSDEERATFNSVWNDGRDNPLGQAVGERIEDLIPAVAAALKEQLKGVKL